MNRIHVLSNAEPLRLEQVHLEQVNRDLHDLASPTEQEPVEEGWLVELVLRALASRDAGEKFCRVMVALFLGYFLVLLGLAFEAGSFTEAVR